MTADEDDRSDPATAERSDRCRERVREAVPPFAGALLDARGATAPEREALDAVYRTALGGCFRLLGLAHVAAPSAPGPWTRSAPPLPAVVTSVHEELAHGSLADDRTAYWDAVAERVRRFRDGGLPVACPGPFVATGDDAVRLTDAAFGPVLAALFPDGAAGEPLTTREGDGTAGDDGADRRRAAVRALGTAYGGLLGSELAVADEPLTTREGDGTDDAGGTDTDGGTRYVPAGPDDPVAVGAGECYLHDTAADRKTSGTYYTRPRFVEHLLDHSLAPALADHLDRVDRVREEGGDGAASAALFDFRVADIAMGAGGFLLAATDRIVAAFGEYLDGQPLVGVSERLGALENAADAPVDRERLLRWLVVRHCVYGVDLDPLATDLARLSLWAEAFVPGPGAPALAHALRTGDSLAGIGAPDEARAALDAERAALSAVADDLGDLREPSRRDDSSTPADADGRRATVDDRLAPLRARLDVAAAARIDDAIDTDAATAAVDDPTTLPEYDRARTAFDGVDPLHFPAAFPEVFAGRDGRETDATGEAAVDAAADAAAADGTDGAAGRSDDGCDTAGFDVLLGNPPWEKAKSERHAFWARYEPGLRGLSQTDREAAIDRLECERPGLAERFQRERRRQERRAALLTEGPYPGLGASDPDLYVAFAWRFWSLLAPGGHAGVVLPRAAFVGAAAESWRRRLLGAGTVTDLTFLVNTGGWVFPELHGQFTVALASFRRTAPGPDATLPVRGPFPDAERYERGVERPPHEFDAADATRWTDAASLPVLPPDPRAAGAFERLADTPRLGRDDPDDWRVRPLTELHGTQDKTRDDGTPVMSFVDDPPESFRPVYTGGSFDLWEPDTGSYYAWADPEVALDYLQERRERSCRFAGSRSPFAELPEPTVADPDTLRYHGPRLAYREVTNRTNRRTVVPALVPPRVVLNHKAPFFLRVRGDERDETYLLGVLASIPLDWYARRFVENTVSFYLLNAFPVPRPGRDHPLRRRVVELAGRLAAIDERYADWADAVGVEYGPLDGTTRTAMIRELDAVVAHLYGLSRADLRVVFGTFHEHWDAGNRLGAVLSHYDDWEARLADEADERTADEGSPAGGGSPADDAPPGS